MKAKRSFFQRVTQKDEGAGSHFVGVVAGINNVRDTTELIISDGYYCIKVASLKRSGNDPANYTGEDKMISLIADERKIYPGMKLHFVN